MDHVELSSPLSTAHFTGAPGGSIYGLATEPKRFADRSTDPKSSVRGLYIGGVDATTPGIAGALSGGVAAAAAAEPIRAARFLRPLMRRPR